MSGRKDEEKRSTFYGLNLADPRYCADASEFLEARDIKNVKLNKIIGLQTREGRTLIGTVTEDIHSLGWFEDATGVDYVVAGAGDKIYLDSGGAGAPALSHTHATGFWDKRAVMASYTEHLFYVDGYNTNLKYDGTNWYKLGVTAPANKPTVAVNPAAGNLNGTYQYLYVYLHKNAGIGYEVESRKSPFSDEVSPVNEQVDVTIVASADPQVSNIRIFRMSDVAVSWQLVAEVANANAVYTDNIADAVLGRAIVYPDEGEPLNDDMAAVVLEGVCKWKNRMWGWAGSWLYRTREGRPEKWLNNESPDYQPINIDPASGQRIVAVVPFQNTLFVFTENMIVYITGDEEPFIKVEYINKIGCIAQRTAIVTPFGLPFLSKEGVYLIQGDLSYKHVSRFVDYDYEKNGRGMMDIPVTSLRKASALYSSEAREYWISVPSTTLLTVNCRTFVLSFDVLEIGTHSPWSYYNFGTDGAPIGFTDATEDKNMRVFTAKASAATRSDYNLEFQGSLDEGAAIAWYYETRHWDFGQPRFSKGFLDFVIRVFSLGSVRFKTIFDFGRFTDVYTITASGDEYDAGIFDTAHWAGAQLHDEFNSYPMRAIGDQVGFRLESATRSKFETICVTYTLEGRMVT